MQKVTIHSAVWYHASVSGCSVALATSYKTYLLTYTAVILYRMGKKQHLTHQNCQKLSLLIILVKRTAKTDLVQMHLRAALEEMDELQ